MTDLASMIRAVTDDASWIDPLTVASDRWEINTETRQAMWLAQFAHETAGLTRTVESLRYSAKALRRTWPNRFSEADAQAMQYNERAIGERAYGGRMGNGPEGSGDGFLYRGRGFMVTGRGKYRECGRALLLDLEAAPQLLEQKQWAAQSGGWYWAAHGCNELADDLQFVGITKIINGGLTGIDDRLAWLDKVQAA